MLLIYTNKLRYTTCESFRLKRRIKNKNFITKDRFLDFRRNKKLRQSTIFSTVEQSILEWSDFVLCER